MGPIDFLLHLLNFVAPAFGVALGVALAARVLWPAQRASRWWLLVALNTAVGALVLLAGLAWFGNDGKIATYAALVIAVATAQWLAGRGWRG